MSVNKYLGPIGLTELINLIQADLQKKQDWVQFPEIPDATLYHGKVIQYTGISNADYTKGFFYYSNGLEWVNIAISNAVEICAVLPLWDDAKAGIIYYVTSESACYIKGSERDTWLNIAGGDSKSFEIVNTLPAWDAADAKIIYMVPATDGSTVTGYIKDANTVGKFYKLGGGSVKGFELVVTLPSYADADPDVLYLVINGTKLAGYVKDVNTAGQFFELGAAPEPAFEIVDTLPAWASASVDKIYFLKDGSKLFGYIKNEAGGWFMFGSSGGIEQVTVLPAWADADPDILYLIPDENGLLSVYKKDPDHAGKFFELSGNDAITMEDIEDIFDEVFGN